MILKEISDNKTLRRACYFYDFEMPESLIAVKVPAFPQEENENLYESDNHLNIKYYE